MGENIVLVFHIYGAIAIFYYFVITKTLNLSYKKWKLVYLNQYKHMKNIKGYMGQGYP